MADNDDRLPWPRQEHDAAVRVPRGGQARRAAGPADTDPAPRPRPTTPAPGSRRARRLAEDAAGAHDAPRPPDLAAPSPTGPDGGPLWTPRRSPGPAPEPTAPGRGPLLPLLATTLLAWSITCLPDLNVPHQAIGLLAVAASISPLVTVGAVPVGTLALRNRRWITGGLAIAAGLLPWAFVLPYAVPTPATNQPVTPVRVLVANAQKGHAEPSDISALVREQPVDLLVITELTNRMAHDLTVNGLDGKLVARWVSVPPSTAAAARSGLGVWSRLPMSGFTKVPGTHWPAVRATLQTGHGTLTVVAGHTVPPTLASEGIWAADLAALHDAAQVLGPVTVVGGLNGTPWNAQFRTATSDGLHDAADVLGRGIRPTWPSWLGIPLLPLDHALVGGKVGVQSLTGVTIDGTDHRALVVTLLVPDGSR